MTNFALFIRLKNTCRGCDYYGLAHKKTDGKQRLDHYCYNKEMDDYIRREDVDKNQRKKCPYFQD